MNRLRKQTVERDSAGFMSEKHRKISGCEADSEAPQQTANIERKGE